MKREYKCTKCEKSGCKLWREYQIFADHTQLLCFSCACKDQGKDEPDVNEQEMVLSKHGGRTDQIGWLIPAVPTEDGETFWGYTSVPQDRVDWWKKLPIA